MLLPYFDKINRLGNLLALHDVRSSIVHSVRLSSVTRCTTAKTQSLTMPKCTVYITAKYYTHTLPQSAPIGLL